MSLPKKLQTVCWIAGLIMALAASAAASKTKTQPLPGPRDLQLSGGRSLIYERSFSSQREVKLKRGLWNRLVDFVAGAPEYHNLVRPYSVAVDSRGKVIVTDPGIPGVHIFDFNQQKYKF